MLVKPQAYIFSRRTRVMKSTVSQFVSAVDMRNRRRMNPVTAESTYPPDSSRILLFTPETRDGDPVGRTKRPKY